VAAAAAGARVALRVAPGGAGRVPVGRLCAAPGGNGVGDGRRARPAEGGGQRRWRLVRHRRPGRARADPLGRQWRGAGGGGARVHAHAVPLRQLARRGGAVAAAVRTARGPAATGAGAGPLLPLRAWLPGLRGAGAGQRRNRGPVGQGGGRAGAGTAGGRGLSALARRLAGLREQAGAATRAEPAAPRGPATAAKAAARAAVGGTSSDVLARRLAGLRRQAGAASTAPVAVAPTPAAPASKPASTADQVAQLRKLLGLRPRALS